MVFKKSRQAIQKKNQKQVKSFAWFLCKKSRALFWRKEKMKNAVKNTAIVLLALTTVGLTAKVVNDSNGWLDKIIAKEPASENYLQIGDELCGKTVYFDYAAYMTEIATSYCLFGTLTTDAVGNLDSATVTTAWYYTTPYLYMGINYAAAKSSVITAGFDADKGIYTIPFDETISGSGGNFTITGTSLTIETINEEIDVNRYFAYSEEALSEWKTYRKSHPFVKEETEDETSSESPTSDSETSEAEVKEKAKTETYAREIVPTEDEDGRFGAFC